MSDNLDDIPLPEPCTLNDEIVETRKDLVEESDGNLFNRKCDNLDNTIPKRKDHFIECEELPDVPKVLLKNKQFNEVEFPGVPLAEIPKKLMAHLLPCCLEGRSAGFDFEVVQDLNSQGKKAQISDITQASLAQSATVFPLSIQLGTYGYILIGLDIKPDICFCDEDCGDEDYIHIRVNLDAEYHDQDDDRIVQRPDLTISDEQLSNFIANYGGGGGGNPLCSKKLFGICTSIATNGTGGLFLPYPGGASSNDSSNPNNYISASLAPYLSGFQLVQSGIYKLEYLCEYNEWYVTDGQCSNLVPIYPYPDYRIAEVTGTPNYTYTGTIVAYDNSGNLLAYPYDDIRYTVDAASTLTEEKAFADGIDFSIQFEDEYGNQVYSVDATTQKVSYSFQLNDEVDGTIIYNIVLFHTTTGSGDEKALTLILKLKDNTVDSDSAEEEEED